MRILLFGMTGQLGWELQRALAPLGEIVALGRHGAAPLQADFARPQDLAATVRAVAPQVIVNAAAYTAVDAAEAEPQLAHAVNAEAPAQLALAAATAGAWLVHYSTDHVFDGSGSDAWPEDAPAGPVNVYGHSKLQGERAIRASGCRHLLLRTSWVHAPRRSNFVRRVLELAAERDQIEVVTDQVGAPTGADLVADVTAHTLRAALLRPELAGTYHLAAAGEASRHAVARLVVELAHDAGAALRARPHDVLPARSRAVQGAARRPCNSRLDTRKLRSTFDVVLPDWRVGVSRTVRELLC